MHTRGNGPLAFAIPQPVWATDDAAAAAAAAAAATPAAAAPAGGTPPASGDGKDGDQNGSVAFDAGTAYAALDEDTRKWLQTKDLTDPAKLAKSAYEQEKMLGNRVKLPGKDATPEERDAFYKQIGRPDTADGYKFNVPEKLPEGLPYDADRAKTLAAAAHKIGLTPEQAQAVHDLYIEDMTAQFTGAAGAQTAQLQQKATSATDALVKRWGPLDGETAQANIQLADKLFTDVPGGQDVLTELKAIGLVGPNKEILSEPLAVMFANLGAAFFKEDAVLRGNADEIGNPFAEGEGSNLTQAMQLVKNDPDRARSLIAAAGKKPADFGLSA